MRSLKNTQVKLIHNDKTFIYQGNKVQENQLDRTLCAWLGCQPQREWTLPVSLGMSCNKSPVRTCSVQPQFLKTLSSNRGLMMKMMELYRKIMREAKDVTQENEAAI